MKNPYALLNYDMENNKSTPEFEKATNLITSAITDMVNGIKSEPSDVIEKDPQIVGWAFYGNLHWGSIGEDRTTGDARVDELIQTAVNKIVEFAKGPEDHGGIGDTATDESIADEVDRLMKSTTVMHSTLLNRA